MAFDEDTVLTGSQDGLIRIISILPNSMLGVVGEHGDFPVETLALSHDRCAFLWSPLMPTSHISQLPGDISRQQAGHIHYHSTNEPPCP